MRGNVEHADDSNVEKILYKLGYRDVKVPWYWKLKVNIEGWWEKRQLLKEHTEEQNFLHCDLRELRYIGRSRKKCARVRYFDKEGKLKSRMFFVKLNPSGFYLTEFTNDYPIDARPTKGPMTVKSANLFKVQYSLFGLRRRKVWCIQFNQTY